MSTSVDSRSFADDCQYVHGVGPSPDQFGLPGGRGNEFVLDKLAGEHKIHTYHMTKYQAIFSFLLALLCWVFIFVARSSSHRYAIAIARRTASNVFEHRFHEPSVQKWYCHDVPCDALPLSCRHPPHERSDCHISHLLLSFLTLIMNPLIVGL